MRSRNRYRYYDKFDTKGDAELEKYVFSGSLTNEMHDRLLAMPDFEPLDILVTQLDRSSCTKTIQWKHEGFCRWFFVDSGAFSIHTGNAKLPGWNKPEPPTFRDWEDAYIEYINSVDDDIDVFAQLDTIPGKFNQPKTPEDYAESAKKSWENFLYMRSKVKSPNKCMPVFHYGESFDALKHMLEWRDEDGEPLNYVGISPANDVPQQDKNIYLQNVANVIAASSNPNVKTHLYGMTSLDSLSKYPCYSADSISHRLVAAYAKVLSTNFGIISVSKNPRTSATKSNMSFLDTCDDYNYNMLKKEVEDLGFTIEQIQESSAIRVVMNMHNIQKLIKTKYAYKPDRVKKQKSLF